MRTIHEQYADSLRSIADWYEKHPEIPLPEQEITNFAVCTPEHAQALIRGLGGCEKDYNDESFIIKKKYGTVQLRFYFSRSEVCKKHVVGTKVVPAHTQYIPERTVDVVEWECMPVMSIKQIEEVSAPQLEVL